MTPYAQHWDRNAARAQMPTLRTTFHNQGQDDCHVAVLHHGQPFQVVEIAPGARWGGGDIYLVRFADGVECGAFAEEIYDGGAS